MKRPLTASNRRRRVLRILLVADLVLLVAVSAIAGWVWLRADSALDRSRAQVPADARRALDDARPGEPRTVLVIGDDARGTDVRGNADSVLLLRFGGDGPTSLTSISRDVVLDAPGGADRGSSLYARGGAGLLIDAVSRSLAMPVHDVAIVRFEDVRALVDELGGVHIDNPDRFVTTPFDGGRWRFDEGALRLSGRRAVAYARARSATTSTEVGETDRLARQQRVLAALARSFTIGQLLRHPLDRPRMAAESATTTLQLGDAVGAAHALRNGIALRCRLGGTKQLVRRGQEIDGTSLVPRRDGLLVVASSRSVEELTRMVTGERRAATVTGGDYPTGCSPSGG